MKKVILTVLGLVCLSLANAQEFTLSKGLTVGCNGANPLTDITKKITVSIDGNEGKMELKSLNCSKSVTGSSMGVVNTSTNAVAYYNSKEEKGFIIENGNKLIVFSGNAGKYEVLSVGHTDKKEAKTVNEATEQSNYASIFGTFDARIQQAKEEAKKAEMQAKMLPIPSGEYSDKYGIGGLYYFSEPIRIEGDKYVSAVLLEFSPEDRSLYAHYAEGKKWLLRIFDGDISKAVKEDKASTVPSFEFDFIYGSDLISRKRIYLIENGLYYVESFGHATSSTDCSNPKYYPAKDKEGNAYAKILFIGKNKARVQELADDFETGQQAVMDAFVSNCEYSKNLYAKNNPMPVPGMNDISLQREATAATKIYADAHWSQTVEYVYIKNTDWVINRNKTTGVIVSRSITAIAVMKTKSGNCQWEEVVLRENYDGTNYGPLYYVGNSQRIYPVDCNTAMKYKK